MFIKGFNKYVCHGDSISTQVRPLTIEATIEYDHDYRIDDDDCHNVDQGVTGCDDEQQKQLLKARQAWHNDEWFYAGVVLSVKFDEILIDDNFAALWGIEVNYPGSDNSYLLEVANELLAEKLAEIQELPKKLAGRLLTS
jgi:hypothetical protein